MSRPIRAAIVDDEPLARRRIRELLEAEPDISVVAEAEDGEGAVRTIGEAKPDLVFLDVQMPGMDGFEVIDALEVPLPRIVFTTAYEAYALRAFQVSAVDYLLKPVDESRFADAVERVRTSLANARPEMWNDRVAELLSRLDRREKSLRRIVVKESGRVFFVELRDVDWIEAAGNYARVYASGSKHLIRSTLQSLQEKLDHRTFVRIHRRVIVNVAKIAELQPRFRGNYAVILKSGDELEMSRAYREELRAVIGEF